MSDWFVHERSHGLLKRDKKRDKHLTCGGATQRLPEGTDRKLCRGYMKHESLGMNDDSKDAINPPLLADSREGSGLRR